MDTFASGDQTTQEPSATTSEPTTAMSFKVGEREYDAESASKKIEHADNFITEMKAKEAEYQAEIARLKAETQQSLKLEEALTKLQSQQAPVSENTTLPNEVANVESQEEVVTRILQERDAKAQEAQLEQLRQSTFTEVQAKLTATYGADHVDKVVRDKAAEIGIDFETAIGMAQDPKQSKVLLKLLDVDTTRQQATPTGQVNTNSLHQPKPTKKLYEMNTTEFAKHVEQLAKQ